jgi:hypothetical protein
MLSCTYTKDRGAIGSLRETPNLQQRIKNKVVILSQLEKARIPGMPMEIGNQVCKIPDN